MISEIARRIRSSRSGLPLALVGLAICSPVLDGQERLPRFLLQSRNDLVQAVGTFNDETRAFPRAAIVALEGRRVLGWVLSAVRDESLPIASRLAALKVLGYSKDSTATDALLDLVHDPNWAIRAIAKEVFRVYPNAKACEFWRGLLLDPSATGGDLDHGLIALRYCGSPSDTAVVTTVLSHTSDTVHRDLAARTMAILREGRLPAMAQDGRYVPSPAAEAEIERAACGAACPPGLLLEPNQPLESERPKGAAR